MSRGIFLPLLGQIVFLFFQGKLLFTESLSLCRQSLALNAQFLTLHRQFFQFNFSPQFFLLLLQLPHLGRQITGFLSLRRGIHGRLGFFGTRRSRQQEGQSHP